MAQASDRDILVAFYHATDGPNWRDNTNWLTDAPLGAWYGVDTDGSGRVVQLDLAGMWDAEARRWLRHGLSGPIPAELGNLGNLASLNLGKNNLVGPIPSELASLAQLRSLDLSNNELEGPIPAWLGSLGNLGYLSLSLNNLAGPIPTELANLAQLRSLWLSGNELEGPIPAELGNLGNLGTLWLGSNNLVGPIPTELANLTQLRNLHLGWNNLVGPIPQSFLQLDELRSFYISGNQGLCVPGTSAFLEWLRGIEHRHEDSESPCNAVDLAALKSLYEAAGGASWIESAGWAGDGAVEEWHGVTADSLGRVTALDLTSNGLAGRLPAGLSSLAQMTELRIAGNPGLAGRLPLGLAHLPLRTLHYAGTGVCAPSDASFDAWLSGLPQHEGTGMQCPPLSDREILTVLYETTDGPGWRESGNWFTDTSLGAWDGVKVDAAGRVVSLDLRWNGLRGPIPPELGGLAQLDTLILFDNRLSGPIPAALGNLAKVKLFVLAANELEGPIPPELGGLASLEELHVNDNRLTSVPPELGRLNTLRILSLAENQLTSIPPELGGLGNLEWMNLNFNQLTTVPPELGLLAKLEALELWSNELTTVPRELGQLSNLRVLDLEQNRLASIPPELARLENLAQLWLNSNELTAIPAELSALERLWRLVLEGNRLTAIPHWSSGFANLWILDLSENELTSFPGELSGLGNLRVLELDGNRLTDIPSGLGGATRATRLAFSRAVPAPTESERWSESDDPWRWEAGENRVDRVSRKRDRVGAIRARMAIEANQSPDARTRSGAFPSLDVLDLSSNELSGPLPAGMLEFTGITSLSLGGNAGLTGPLPLGLTALERLDDLHTTGTGLCAPADPEFLDWLDGVTRQRVAPCAASGSAAAYLTQAVQSREFPVPLIASEPALLRVFLTVKAGAARMPPVRATFYRDGAVVHRTEIPGTSAPVPAAITEGNLSTSANAEIPGSVVQPGLEVVIEPDPEGTLDPALGVVERIPATGRMAVDVRVMPVFEVTLVPFIWRESPKPSIVDTVAAMAADPEGHALFERTHLLLPISEIDATAHPPVTTSTNNGFELLEEVEMIRVAEGGRGHYLAVMAPPTTPRFLGGVAYSIGSWSSFSRLNSEIIAHEFGHNRNLYHAPCGGAGGPDRYYPYGEGNIGAWGYDFQVGSLVEPGKADFMSYCDPTWTSDYQFTNALRYRIETETGSILIAAADAGQAASGRALMVWGGLDGEGVPSLRPSFFIDAPPALPQVGGPWSLTGTDTSGAVLFSLSFAMSEFADTDDRRAGFTFAVPVTWTGELASVTLQGPGGSASLDRDTDDPITILRDAATGRIRAILDGRPPSALSPSPGVPAAAAEEGFDILFSRGIPSAGNEQR